MTAVVVSPGAVVGFVLAAVLVALAVAGAVYGAATTPSDPKQGTRHE